MRLPSVGEPYFQLWELRIFRFSKSNPRVAGANASKAPQTRPGNHARPAVYFVRDFFTNVFGVGFGGGFFFAVASDIFS